jgi:hypothetical protein
MWITITILFVLAIACAAATVIEARSGTPAAQALVYRARWFEGLIALMILNLIAMFVIRWPYHKARIGFVITHLAIIWILISAGITRYFGYEGYMTIREGSSTGFMFSREDYLQLEVGSSRVAAPIDLWKAGPQRLTRDLRLAAGVHRVEILEHWPHAKERLVEGNGGEPAADVELVTGDHRHRDTLRPGHAVTEGGVTVELVSGALAPPASASPYGEVVIESAGATFLLPVPHEGSAETNAGDLRVRITEFRPSFKVGAERKPDDAMDNPAVRISIEGRNGRTEERLLFAHHPEFDLSHTGAAESFPDVHATYRFERSLRLRVAEPGVAEAIASFPVTVTTANAERTGSIAAGQTFRVEESSTVESAGFSLAATRLWRSAVAQLGPSDDERDPAMARVRVSDPSGAQAEALVRLNDADISFPLGDEIAHLAIGPRRVDLPYRVHLDDFVLVTYPGSENPAGFESHVRVIDEAKAGAGEPFRIYMNHPLTYRGFKHFQSSYDPDRKGTVLSVNHDPGKWPTYIGYILICLGFMVTLTRGKLWLREAR